MLEKCVLTILELNWKQCLGHKKTKLNIRHDMLTSSTQLQNRSFHVLERTRTSSKCQKKNEKCTCKACKNTVFHCQICKFVGFLLPSSSWLLKLPKIVFFNSMTSSVWLIIDLFSLYVLFCTLVRDTLKIVFLLSFHDLCLLMQ